jgi:hypothetical protein
MGGREPEWEEERSGNGGGTTGSGGIIYHKLSEQAVAHVPRSVTSTGVHLVERPNDLRELQSLLGELRGVTCWRTYRGCGDEVVLDFGAQHGYQHPLLIGQFRGEWVLRARAWFRNAVKEETWPEGPDRSGLIPEVEGARVTATEIAFPSMELTLWFDREAALRVVPDPDERERPGWELLTASGMYVEVGPGRRWLSARADLPVECD